MVRPPRAQYSGHARAALAAAVLDAAAFFGPRVHAYAREAQEAAAVAAEVFFAASDALASPALPRRAPRTPVPPRRCRLAGRARVRGHQ